MIRNLIATVTALAFAAMPAFAEEAKPAAEAYPLKTCVVSGEPLGSMGKPYVHTEDGKEVQFCCKSCLPKFKKDTAKYLKKLEDAKAS